MSEIPHTLPLTLFGWLTAAIDQAARQPGGVDRILNICDDTVRCDYVGVAASTVYDRVFFTEKFNGGINLIVFLKIYRSMLLHFP